MAGLSLSGMASGVDTASIVEQLMAIERQSLTRIGYRKAAVSGQQDALKEVASKLSALKDAALALNADSTWAQKQTVESSDPTRVAVSMMAGAGIGGQSLQVDRLASSAQRRYDFTPAAFDDDGKTSRGPDHLARLRGGTEARASTINIAAGSTKQQIAAAINASTKGPAVAALVKDIRDRPVGAQDRRELGLHMVDPNGAVQPAARLRAPSPATTSRPPIASAAARSSSGTRTSSRTRSPASGSRSRA